MTTTPAQPPLPDIHCPFSQGEICPVRQDAVEILRTERLAEAFDRGGLKAIARAWIQNKVIAAAPTTGELARAHQDLTATETPGCNSPAIQRRHRRIGAWSIVLRPRRVCGHHKMSR